MSAGPKPTAEVAIDGALVRALLETQHADLAHLALLDAGEGWDNRLFQLGDEYAVRLPRRAASAALIAHEQEWLPRLAADLPLPVPIPQRVGRPGCGFPWAWSITPWFDGSTALAAPLADAPRVATALGAFVQALHRPAPHDAPRNPWRGVPLDARTQTFREHLARLGPIVDDIAARRLWDRAAASLPWRGSPLWIHGDLHPGNLLIDADRISAVIDFGDLAAGDPATDLSIAWMLFAPAVRPLFLSAARGPFDPIDADTVMRARGWALALGLAYLARSRDDPALHALGLTTVEAALTDTDTPHGIAPM